MSAKIGILALQGGFREHGAHLRECGIDPVYVRAREDLDGCCGLIIPGGESSCLRRLLKAFEMDRAIVEAVNGGHCKVWGTCAGAILCADEVEGEAPCLSLIEAAVERNVFGAQLASFTEKAVISPVSDAPQTLVYIRAPGIVRVWGETRVLHSSHGHIAAAENGNVLITTFHPELSETLAFHRYFAKKCGVETSEERRNAWEYTSWMRF